MQLVIIRHAIAVDRSPDITDDERPLTGRGKRLFRSAARGLARLVPAPDELLSSPLVRARQTARIAARAWGGLAVKEEASLAGGSIDEVMAVLGRFPGDARVALVGHEPQVSELLAHLLGSDQPEGLAFKKGGVALVELPGSPAAGGALAAFLPPRVLRATR